MLQSLPNLLTIARIAVLPILWWTALQGDRSTFGVLVLACLALDVLDGLLARALHATTRFGALLDSVGDALLLVTAVGGLVLLYPTELSEHRVAFWSVPVAWLAENAAALVRYGRLSSFHTYLSRTAAVAMGLFGIVLFTRGFEPLLLRAAAVLVAVATLEEFVLLYLLREWTPDVRGAAWVLSRADRDTESRDRREAAPRG
jgi:CDP-diacylglycerol--glycerol-3-phosphate 3-phosphatidyltransferase